MPPPLHHVPSSPLPPSHPCILSLQANVLVHLPEKSFFGAMDASVVDRRRRSLEVRRALFSCPPSLSLHRLSLPPCVEPSFGPSYITPPNLRHRCFAFPL